MSSFALQMQLLKRASAAVLTALIQEAYRWLASADKALLVLSVDAIHVDMGAVGRAHPLPHGARLDLVGGSEECEERVVELGFYLHVTPWCVTRGGIDRWS